MTATSLIDRIEKEGRDPFAYDCGAGMMVVAVKADDIQDLFRLGQSLPGIKPPTSWVLHSGIAYWSQYPWPEKGAQ